MSDFELEHQAPPFTIVEQRVIGKKILTTVVLDGVLSVFEGDAGLHAETRKKLVSVDPEFEEVMKGFEEDS